MPDHCPWPLNKLFLKCMILDVFSLVGSSNPVIPDTKQLKVPTSSSFPKDCSIPGCERAQKPFSSAKTVHLFPHPKSYSDNEIIIHLYLNVRGCFFSLKSKTENQPQFIKSRRKDKKLFVMK